jgi:cysteine desulfuration protein SufE
MTATATATATIEELASNFEILDDWEARYEYITELGNRLGTLPDADKTDATKVHGCMSNVYVVGDLADDPPGTITYRAECDTAVIRGVIAILLMIYTGHTPQQVLDLDADELFDRLGLFDHLSPTRHVGVYAIVERIRTVARELAAPGH